MPATPTVDAIGVVVTDMARSLSFYRRLGCDFPEGAESEGHVTAELGGGVRLMLDTVQSLEEMSFDIGDEEPGHGWMTLAVRCGCPGEVDSLYAELAAQGLGRVEPFDAVWGQRYACVRDPDGSHVDLYAPVEDGAGVG